MRWPTSRRAGDSSDTDSVEETPAEPSQTATVEDGTVEDETKMTEAATEVEESGPDEHPVSAWRRIPWSRSIAYGMLPDHAAGRGGLPQSSPNDFISHSAEEGTSPALGSRTATSTSSDLPSATYPSPMARLPNSFPAVTGISQPLAPIAVRVSATADLASIDI